MWRGFTPLSWLAVLAGEDHDYACDDHDDDDDDDNDDYNDAPFLDVNLRGVILLS